MIAQHMVKDWGMASDKIGLRTFETTTSAFEASESLGPKTVELVGGVHSPETSFVPHIVPICHLHLFRPHNID